MLENNGVEITTVFLFSTHHKEKESLRKLFT